MDPASRLRAFEGHWIVLNSPVMPFLKLKCTHTHIYTYIYIYNSIYSNYDIYDHICTCSRQVVMPNLLLEIFKDFQWKPFCWS